jgi:hypothetical protein
VLPGGDNEVQRTMLEIVNQLDGFDSRGNIKVKPSIVDGPLAALCQTVSSCLLRGVVHGWTVPQI